MELPSLCKGRYRCPPGDGTPLVLSSLQPAPGDYFGDIVFCSYNFCYYEDELKSSKSLPSNDRNLQNEIETRLEQSVDLLSTLDCNADPSDEAELLKVKKACILTTELVRKCMKLAIELIEAEAKDANNFMAYMHSEPDLILHCQEIENYCNNLLPTEKEEAEIGKSNY